MNKFNWWRRGHKARPKLRPAQTLRGKSKLLQQIEHGDFDLSPYRALAVKELALAQTTRDKITSNWKGRPESLREKLETVDFTAQKRYNRLYKDYHEQEQRLLDQLKHKLRVEFKVDLWDYCLQQCEDQDVKQFYQLYKQYAQQAAKP